MTEGMTYEELRAFAKENYTKGGDGVYECWDKEAFDDWVHEFGPITTEEALYIIYYDKWREIRATIW